MYKFGAKSNAKLDTCHPLLMKILRKSLERSPYDMTVIHGWRGEEIQNSLFESGLSKTPWPASKHNRTNASNQPCSEAVDFAPWVKGKIDWEDTLIFAALAGVIMATGKEIINESSLDARMRWGGDWDGDGSSRDQSFMDIGHIEVIFND